jgi:acyl-CoA hydrolase
MDYSKIYIDKCVSAEKAASLVSSGDIVDYGSFNGKPIACDQALGARAEELRDVSVFGICTVPPVPEVSKHPKSFTYNDWHWTKLTRLLEFNGMPFYSPVLYQRAGFYHRHSKPKSYRAVNYGDRELGKNVKVISISQATPMDKHGYFNLGPQCSHSIACIDTADIVIIETNPNQPTCIGVENAVHISQVDYIVEGSKNQELFYVPEATHTEIDQAIADHIMHYIHDGCCIQLGIGGLPNLIGEMLAESDLKDLGGHTEMFMDAYMKMIENGKMNGSRKNIDHNLCAYTFALGSKKMFEFMDNNPGLIAYPVEYTNHDEIIGEFDNFVSINNALQVDLFSQVNAESLVMNEIPQQISGNGGMLDFVMGSHKSYHGRSFIALASTYKDKDGTVRSRIVPSFEPGTIVTVPRQCVDFIVTEYGAERMQACPTWMRAEKLINLAHPDFRDDLIKQAEKMKIWRRTNKIL